MTTPAQTELEKSTKHNMNKTHRPWTTLEVPLGAKVRSKPGFAYPFQNYICWVSRSHVHLFNGTEFTFQECFDELEWRSTDEEYKVCGIEEIKK